MKSFTLKDIVAGQAVAKIRTFNNDLFTGDREPFEQFDKSVYSEFHLVAQDHAHDKGEHDKLVETVVAIGHESDFYLVVATSTSYNNEKQVSFTEQPMTLKGLNFFTKDYTDLDLTEVYDNYLVSKGYEMSIEDIKTLGELNSEYNCTTLKFRDDEETMHYLTVNAKNQLSSITVKANGREVKPAQQVIQSAFN